MAECSNIRIGQAEIISAPPRTEYFTLSTTLDFCVVKWLTIVSQVIISWFGPNNHALNETEYIIYVPQFFMFASFHFMFLFTMKFWYIFYNRERVKISSKYIFIIIIGLSLIQILQQIGIPVLKNNDSLVD